MRFAAKLVRGAYMAAERDLAASMGVPSPVCETKEDTDAVYDGTVRRLMATAADGDELLVATHNERSVRRGLAAIAELGLPRDGPVSFAQLLGMRDNVSLALGRDGYSVYKYVPYGPVDLVVPYLLRRVDENSSASSMLGGLARERAEISREILRRLTGRRQ